MKVWLSIALVILAHMLQTSFSLYLHNYYNSEALELVNE